MPKELFACDFCGDEFEWDDNCTEIDDVIYTVTTLCKRCRGDDVSKDRYDPDAWKNE